MHRGVLGANGVIVLRYQPANVAGAGTQITTSGRRCASSASVSVTSCAGAVIADPGPVVRAVRVVFGRMSVLVRLGVRVSLGVLVGLGVRVSLGVLLRLGVRVSLGVSVSDGVLVCEGVLLRLGVRVTDAVFVYDGVLVTLPVCSRTTVTEMGSDAVGLIVTLTLAVSDSVGVAGGVADAVTVDCGVWVVKVVLGVMLGGNGEFEDWIVCVVVICGVSVAGICAGVMLMVALLVGVVVIVLVGVAGRLNCPMDVLVLTMVVLPSGIRAMLSPLFMAPKSIRSIWLPTASRSTTASPVLLRMALLSAITTSCCGAMVVPAAMVVTVPPGVSSSMRQPLTSTMVLLAL